MPTIVDQVIDCTIRSAINKGGAGSGNFGHSGRPGKQGGSAGGTGGGQKLTSVQEMTRAMSAWASNKGKTLKEGGLAFREGELVVGAVKPKKKRSATTTTAVDPKAVKAEEALTNNTYTVREEQNYQAGNFESQLVDVEGAGKAILKPDADYEGRSTYVGEVGSYEVAKHLYSDLVPTTVTREEGGKKHSLQSWVEGATEGTAADWDSVSDAEIKKLLIFDAVIGNEDRFAINVLVTKNGKVKAIDNGLGFPETQATDTTSAFVKVIGTNRANSLRFTAKDLAPVKKFLLNKKAHAALESIAGPDVLYETLSRATALSEVRGSLWSELQW